MIVLECEQRSDEWHKARLGILTASAFANILTPAKLQPSKSEKAHGYLCQLVAERILGVPCETVLSDWMERGIVMEAEAVAWYEFDEGAETREVGFCLRDDRRVGCSPDRLVGDDGGLEIKNPSAKVHVGYVLDPASLVAAYRLQIQACLWVTGRAWWDIISYNPEIPSVRVRCAPDADAFAAFDEHVGTFLDAVDAAEEAVRSLGVPDVVRNPLTDEPMWDLESPF